MKLNPERLVGPWVEGFTLDRHVLPGTTGVAPASGHPAGAASDRTELGELVYQLKFGGMKEAAPLIAAAAAEFVRERWGDVFDVVVPVPSPVARASYPLAHIASELADVLDLPMITNAVAMHQGTVRQGTGTVAGRRVLLIDDVTGAGDALQRSAEVLQADAGAVSVHALVITRTT